MHVLPVRLSARKRLLAACAAVALAAAHSAPALAAQATNPPSSAVAFALERQPLDSALTRFAVVADVELLYAPEVVRGKSSASVRGLMAPEAALRALLGGTGLTVRRVGTRAFAIVPTETADASSLLDEVVVTATRTPMTVQNLPARVDVITRRDIEDRNYVTAVDALAQTPGINVVQSGGAGALTSVFSRGANSKHTLALFDGIRLNDASSPNGQYNFGQDTVASLERVEVVRGAASSLYGSDAIGGVINFIPRVGGDRPFEPFFEAAIGDRDTYRGAVGAVGTSDRLSYGVTIEHFETGGFNNTPDRFANGLGETDGSAFDAVTAVADLQLTPQAKLRGLARWRDTETDLDDSALDRIGRSSTDTYFVWRVGPSFSLADDRLKIDLNAGQVRNEREDLDEADANQAFPAPSGRGEGVRSFANWRNAFDIGDLGVFAKVEVSGGVEWQRERIEVSGGYSDPLTRSEKSLGFYALARGTAFDRVDLSASARRDDTDAFGAADTWNLGAVVDLPEVRGRVYASAGTSFKAPSLSERFTTSTYYVANPSLRPEEGESWEIGADFRPLEGNIALTLGATYFSSRIDDLIEYDFAQLKNINIGKAEIEGHEAYIEFSPAAFLKGRLNYTYTDARNGVTDQRLLRRPPHVWGGSVEVTPNDRLTVTATFLNRGDRVDVLYEDTNPFGLGGGYLGNGAAPGYDIVNLTARYDLTAELSVFGGVTNLFDKDYEDPASYRGAPASWSIGLRGRF